MDLIPDWWDTCRSLLEFYRRSTQKIGGALVADFYLQCSSMLCWWIPVQVLAFHRYCQVFCQPSSRLTCVNWFCSLHYHLMNIASSQICVPQNTYGLFLWYFNAIPLIDFTLKFIQKAQLYHKVESNYHGIAKACFTCNIINVKLVQYYLSARKLCHTKWHLAIMCRKIRPFGCYFIPPYRNSSCACKAWCITY